MKKIILSAFFVLGCLSVNAQLKTPQPSPQAKLEQTVGLTTVSVEYSRPSIKGRTIFGDLVPYGEKWRTGANMNTIVTFSDDVKVGGKSVEKGSYALFTVPKKGNDWDVYLYSDVNNWGLPQNWDNSKVVAKVTGKLYPMGFPIETFTISVDDVTTTGAVLGLLWEKAYIGIPFEVPTSEKAMANIEKVMNGPSSRDYSSAAGYYLSENKDLDQAEEWITKAIEMEGEAPFWMLRQKALILAQQGKTKQAIKTAKASLSAAKKAGHEGYIKMNEESLEEWGAK